MSIKWLWQAVTGIVFVLAFIWTVERVIAWQEAQTQLSEQVADYQQALRLIQQEPEAFTQALASQGELKSAVQKASSKNSVPLGYLSESEKEISGGARDKSVLMRVYNVEQSRLARFLSELESCTAARITELRLKPAQERNDLLQEAEAVLSLRIPETGGKAKVP